MNRLHALLVTAALLVAAIPLRVAAIPEAQLEASRASIIQFLCARSFCFDRSVRIRAERRDGYPGFFDRVSQTVFIDPVLDELDTKLNLVHELTHAYRARFNANEDLWLNEGLAKLIESQYAGTWPVSYQQSLRTSPLVVIQNQPQLYRPNGAGYQYSFWITTYLYNHFGGPRLLTKLLRSPLSGWANVTQALRELKTEGAIAQGDELLTKSAILRHFAVAMWVGDPYAAQYGLFSLDPRYEPLASSVAARIPSPTSFPAGTDGVAYSRAFLRTAATETFAIRSTSPLVVERARAGVNAEIFVYVFINSD